MYLFFIVKFFWARNKDCCFCCCWRRQCFLVFHRFTTISFCFLRVGYHPNGRKPVPSPIDQLLPISEKLVENVENALRSIVQKTIDGSLSKFPTIKKAVEAKVVNRIFDTKREQTIKFIRQFLEMQKKSTDVVFAPVPTPNEIDQWKSLTLTTREGNKIHPCLTSKTMNHMKDLAEKLFPQQLVNEIEGHGNSSTHTAFVNYKVSI